MNELTLDGKTYVSSKRAAEITGYAKDYVGQLCREGRVEARLVGRNWYILESAIREHRFGEKEPENTNTLKTQSSAPAWDRPRYEQEIPPAIPTLSARTSPKAELVSDMQSAWQEWFTRRPATEIPDTLLEVDARSAEIDEEVEEKAASVSIRTIETEIDSLEEEIVYEPQEPLDLKSIAESMNPALEEEVRIEESLEPQRGERRNPSSSVRFLFIVIIVVVVALTALGSGLLERYVPYEWSRVNEVIFLEGISSINK